MEILGLRSVERSNAAGSDAHASKSRCREWWGRELRGMMTPPPPPRLLVFLTLFLMAIV